jgi:hypothetical protein
MKKLKAVYLSSKQKTDKLSDIFLNLDDLEKHSMEFTPWSTHSYKPHVQFCIAYTDSNIYLKYYVAEKFIKAANGFTNSPVYEDACVEFFISFNDEPAYYNFEFNCIGSSLVGYGNGKHSRELLPKKLIDKIKYNVNIRNGEGNLIYWEIMLVIPSIVFSNHSIQSLKGTECNVNFYKCGNSLLYPHFLAWSDIRSSKPDFHLPEFFGKLIFE